MKKHQVFMALILASSVHAAGEEPNPKYGFFERDELPKGQCGCWYHYPREHGSQGKVLGLGEAAEESIYFKIHGNTVAIGNWRYSNKGNILVTEYSNDIYRVNIASEPIEETRFSSTYHSIITIHSGSETDEIKAFGVCGC